MPPHPYPGSIPNLDAIIGGARGIAPTLPPPSHSRTAVLKSKRPTMEQVDERCWIRSRQTNARRALGREPAVSMYCYLNFRHSLADLVPVPGSPNSFIARDAAPGTNASGSVDLKGKGKEVDKPEGLPDYYWPRLDGRYLYIARGREAIARHMKEMGGVAAEPSGEEGAFTVSRKSGDEEKVGAWNTIARIEERCEKLEAERALPGKRQEQMVKRAMGLDEDECVYFSFLHLLVLYSRSSYPLRDLQPSPLQLRAPRIPFHPLLDHPATPSHPHPPHLHSRPHSSRQTPLYLHRRYTTPDARDGRDAPYGRERIHAGEAARGELG